MTIDLINGWWSIEKDNAVMAKLNSEKVTSDTAYKIYDIIAMQEIRGGIEIV